MGSRRYLNSVPKVLDSRKSCRNTKCQAFILVSFFSEEKVGNGGSVASNPLSVLLMDWSS